MARLKEKDENLAYKNTPDGETHHYKNIWEKIADEHYAECPATIAAKKHLPCSICYCPAIEEGNASAEECSRCHNLAPDCKCGKKAQLI